jgi:hypothetical protein
VSTPTAPTAITTAPATTTAAFALLRSRFIYHQGATHKFPAVQRSDHLFRLAIVANLGESESPRLTGKTITKERQ